MYARAVDDAAERLRTLRQEEWADLALAALALALAMIATQVHRQLALPLFLGAVGVGSLGIRALLQRLILVERLASHREAHHIPEVAAYAAGEAELERRRAFAALLRGRLSPPGGRDDPRLAEVGEELAALAGELEDPTISLDPLAAVKCTQLLSDAVESPLLNPSVPVEDLRSRIQQIRAGFQPSSASDAPGRDEGATGRPIRTCGGLAKRKTS